MKRYQRRKLTSGLFLLCAALLFFLIGFEPNSRQAMATSSGSAESGREHSGSFEAEPYSSRVGKKLYMHYCQICHGETGQGNGFNSYTLETQPRDFTDGNYLDALPDRRVAEAIREGGPGVNKSVLMPAWGKTFSPIEINYLVHYLRKFTPKDRAK
ncbi:MAG: cytochrome c [Candidatus Glassbacteria bacterium]|nr:cytochrome c [Candidatus Glassbacteria bacterium]